VGLKSLAALPPGETAGIVYLIATDMPIYHEPLLV